MNIGISSIAYLLVNTQSKGVSYYEMSGLWKERLAHGGQKRKLYSSSTNIRDGALPCLR